MTCDQKLFDSTTAIVMTFSGLSSAALSDMAAELETGYEVFLVPSQGVT